MINLSLRRYLPGWFRSETGDFYLTNALRRGSYGGADLLVSLSALLNYGACLRHRATRATYQALWSGHTGSVPSA